MSYSKCPKCGKKGWHIVPSKGRWPGRVRKCKYCRHLVIRGVVH